MITSNLRGPRRRLRAGPHGAFTRIDLLAVGLGVGVLVGLAIPTLATTQAKSRRIDCLNQLGQIGKAFRGYAAEHGERNPMNVSTNEGGSADYLGASGTSGALFTWAHFRALSNHLASPRALACPSDVGRVAASSFPGMGITTNQNACISYGLGPEADVTRPGMVLVADRSVVGGDLNLEFDGAAARGYLKTNVALLATLGWHTNGMHRDAGNVVRGDGSVLALSSPGLRAQFAASGDFGNNYSQPGKTADR